MDYIKVPRSLIYKERTDLKKFGVQIPGTMNNLLFSNLKEIFMATDRAKDLILRCFNNAYYICTILPFEDFPETQVAEYENLLMKGDSYALELVCTLSMAMVVKLMQACDPRCRQEENDLIKNINYRFTHYRWYHGGAAESYLRMVEKHNTDGLILPQSEFAPRDIIEVIESFPVKDLMTYAEYICERLALVENKQRQIYGSDMAIARLKDYQRELCRDSLYNPKKDSFDYSNNERMAFVTDLSNEDKIRCCYKQSKKALDYYALHTLDYYEDGNHHEQQTDASVSFPVNKELVTENEQLRQHVAQLNSQVNELVKDNAELKEKLAEFLEPLEELTAEQKVRMAFALQLLKVAGLTEEKLVQNKSKVAKVIHLLTGIGANNNGSYPPTQICQNWLVDQRYYPERNIETLKELNTLCAQLGIEKAFLKLAQ